MKKPFYLRNNTITDAGFSLIELALVLVIIGLIASSSISALTNQMRLAKETQTTAKMDTIEQAIAAYLAVNGRLPCPAHSMLPTTDTNFGLEHCTGIASKNMTTVPADFSQTGFIDQWIILGTIPTRTLQLPDEFMVDGWGNRFTFVITEGFAGWGDGAYGTPEKIYYFGNTSTGLLTVTDSEGGLRTDQAAYVFISHGPNGFGAWLHDGNGQRPISTDESEAENGSNNEAFNEFFVQKERTDVFDDVIRYKMKWQLTRAAGAIISNENCTTAHNIIDQFITCDSNKGMADCSSYLLAFANQVNKWCIQQ